MKMWNIGKYHFIPFVITAIGVVKLDLLKGVGLGLVVSSIFILKGNIFVCKGNQFILEGE